MESIEQYFLPNRARLTIPAAQLTAHPCLDTRIDLEIVGMEDISGNFGMIEGLADRLASMYGSQKQVAIVTDSDSHFVTLAAFCKACRDCIAHTAAAEAGGQLGQSLGTALPKSLLIRGEEGFKRERYCFADLIRLIERLTQEDGCPWDKAQTHQSINPNMIEEAYEAAEAVINGDNSQMCEEFGDVMLQSLFNCDIAKRQNEFTLDDCIDRLCKKLYSRHTHIFGEDCAANEAEALQFWESAKAKEKDYSSIDSRIRGISKALPSLMRAQKIAKILQKSSPITTSDIYKELQGLISSLLQGKAQLEDSDLLWLIARLYASASIDAETALLKTIHTHQTQNPIK